MLSFDGDRHHAFFACSAGLKNRFGAADEVAVMEMDERGLHEVTNPSVLFFTRSKPGRTRVRGLARHHRHPAPFW